MAPLSMPLEEDLVGSRELVGAQHVAVVGRGARRLQPPYRRIWLLVPGSVEIRAHTSTSGPYWAALRQAVQVVVFEQASVFEVDVEAGLDAAVDCRSSSAPRPRAGSRWGGRSCRPSGAARAGGRASAGVADASFESAPSPFPLTADTL